MGETTVTPVAVIGMACRLPGGIDSPELLWESSLRGDDLITEIPAGRWDADEYYDPEPGVPGRSISRWGGFLDDVTGFDAPFFGYGEREAAALDPQHRLLLETSWEAVEHAGLAPASLAGSATGVFVGLSHGDYEIVTRDAGALQDAYGYPGTTFSMASGRIAYWLGLRGPAMTVDSACSTGLLTVHLACRSLHEGESDLALAGGCVVMFVPELNASASALGMLSPRGRCRSFDAGADGFVRGEGCAVVLLKRLPDAIRDADRILAVVRGTAANQDGHTKTISRPSLDAQVEVYRAALAAAGVDGATVGMVEAHGTGTPVGDPIEFGSLSQVYGAGGEPCALGSAKSNFGHTECAAGTVGLIKAILALRHGVVPPMVHFTQLPDALARIETGLFVPKVITPWPSRPDRTPRRAAVSSYGVTGTNAHAVLEEAPGIRGTARRVPRLRRPAAVRTFRHFGRSAAAHLGAAGAVGEQPGGSVGAVRSRLHLGAPACTPPSAHGRDRGGPGGPDRAIARHRRGRHPLSARVGPGRPGTGVGVFRAGVAVGRDGRRTAGNGAGVRRNRRGSGATDRPGVGVFGDRGDVGAADGDRYRPGTADPVRHAGGAGRHDALLWGAPGRGHRAFAWARPRPPSSREHCRWKTACASSAAGRGCCRGSPVRVRWRRWNCPPSRCARNWMLAA